MKIDEKQYSNITGDAVIYENIKKSVCVVHSLLGKIDEYIERHKKTNNKAEDIVSLSIEERSEQAMEFLKNFLNILLDLEKNGMIDKQSKENVKSLLSNLRSNIGCFDEKRHLAKRNLGNILFQNQYEMSRNTLEYNLTDIEYLWNQTYRLELVAALDTVKERVVVNEIKIQDSEQKASYLEYIGSIRQYLETTLEIGEITKKFCESIVPGFMYILSKII